jgi:hypothetical protein
MSKFYTEEGLVICQICGKVSSRIYGQHLKSHGLTSEEYKKKFPGAPVKSEADAKNTSKNSGQHMKQEKYKKMFSEKVKGDKNPMHKSKTTDLQRKQNSIYSVEYYKKHYPELSDHEIQLKIDERVKYLTENRKPLPTQLQYYLDKGMSEEESIIELSKRQSTFSKEICVEKYGEEEGYIKWMERQEKWQKSLNENGNLKMGFSGASQDLFNMILDKVGDKASCQFATNGGELRIKKSDRSGMWLYDFCYNGKIIEYQGDMYHANPDKYYANDTPHPFRKELTAFEIWERDRIKKEDAIDSGYDVLYVWDSEFRKVSKERLDTLMEKCLDFLGIN